MINYYKKGHVYLKVNEDNKTILEVLNHEVQIRIQLIRNKEAYDSMVARVTSASFDVSTEAEFEQARLAAKEAL